MAPPVKPGGPKGKGGGLGKKVGPFPVWGWGVILLAGIGLALYLRSHAGTPGATAAPASTSATTTPAVAGSGAGGDSGGGGSGDGGGGAGSAGSGTTGTFDIGSAFSQLLGENTNLAGTAAAAGTQGQAQSYDFASSVFSDALSLLQTRAQTSGAGGPGAGGGGDFEVGGGGGASTPASKQVPFGGILSTRTAPNGTLLTYYRNGRIVEQAPGKSAYVAKKGG
ncbi:MAG: hypothetical protein ACRD2H_13900 [Terriglobales bacterium]